MKKITFIVCFLSIIHLTTELEFKICFYKIETDKTTREFFIYRSEIIFPFCKEVVFVVDTCLENNINPLVFLALLKNENPTLNCFAVNKNKNVYGEFDIFNWQHNSIIAIKHFKTLLKNTDTVENAVMAYNCGLGNVERNSIPKITEHYLEKWNENYIKMKESI